MISTAVFDLETSALEADRGVILCACIKSSKRRGIITIRTDETSAGWRRGRRGDDKETVKQVAAILADHDVLVAHNGTRFDMPFLRSRMLRWNMPRLPQLKIIDPCTIAYRHFKLRSNSLAAVADHIGVRERKTPLDMSTWADAFLNGSRSAMNKIVEHCVADIKVLEGVLRVVTPYVKILDDRGSAL